MPPGYGALSCGSGPDGPPARMPSSTIDRWRRQASGQRCSFLVALPIPHITIGMSSTIRSSRSTPAAWAREMSRDIVSVSPSTVGMTDSVAPGMLANTSLSARSPAIVSAPLRSTEAKASHGSSTSRAASAVAAIVSKAATISASISASLVGKWR